MSFNLDRSTWKRVVFGDVIDSITERVDNPSQAGVERYVGLEHLDPGVMAVQRWDSPDKVEAQKLRFAPGDVIFGRRRAYQRKVAQAEFDGICSAHALVLRARPDYVDPGFLPVFLSSDYFLDRAIEISVGSLSPTINWRDLKVQEFDLPPLDQQKRLAGLFWSVERHRRSLEAARHALVEVRTGFVADVIGSRSSDVLALESLIRAGTRVTYGIVQAGRDVEGGVPYIRVSDMTNGVLGLEGMKRTAPEIAAKFARSRVEVGDLVVALRGRTGLTMRVPPILDGANLTQGTARVAIDSSNIDPAYVAAVMNSEWMAPKINRHAKGSTFTELTLAALKKLPIPRLGRELEVRFVSELSAIDGAAQRLDDEHNSVRALQTSITSLVYGGT